MEDVHFNGNVIPHELTAVLTSIIISIRLIDGVLIHILVALSSPLIQIQPSFKIAVRGAQRL